MRPIRRLRRRGATLLHQLRDLRRHVRIDGAINDVKAEARLHHWRDLTRLDGLERRLELRRHHALGKCAERSALRRRARVLTELARQCREIGRREHLMQRIGAIAQLLQLFRRCALFRETEQNVAGREHFTVVVARFTVGWRSDRERLRDDCEEFARASVGDWRPEG